MELPKFKYHPDPVETGSIDESNNVCLCCGKSNGYIYVGPVYSEKDELEGDLCPWCIADGSAHTKFDVNFVDIPGVGGHGKWDIVSQDIMEEISFRTPGFTGWQQERWWTHCGDGAEFLGIVGRDEIVYWGDDFIKYIRDELKISDDKDWEEFLNLLDKNRGPTAYVFRCKKCGKLGGYSDWI
jgi:uncharacterized protein